MKEIEIKLKAKDDRQIERILVLIYQLEELLLEYNLYYVCDDKLNEDLHLLNSLRRELIEACGENE